MRGCCDVVRKPLLQHTYRFLLSPLLCVTDHPATTGIGIAVFSAPKQIVPNRA